MSRRQQKRWTPADDANLRAWYPARPTTQVAIMLQRSVGTVYVRAHTLGIAKQRGKRRPKGTHINGGKLWTAAEIKLLRRIYPSSPGLEIARRLKRRPSQIYAMATKLALRKDREAIRLAAREAMKANKAAQRHQFPKGHVPRNKGVKGWQAGGRAVLTQFKPGQKPHTTKPIGSLRIGDGLLCVKVTDTGYVAHDWQPLQRKVWELKHGPIPPGHIVRFIDGNQRNFADDNLECISKADNMRRNTIHNLPAPLKGAIQVLGQLKRRINEKQDRGSTQPPVRNAGGTARQGQADGPGPRKNHRRRRADDRELRQG